MKKVFHNHEKRLAILFIVLMVFGVIVLNRIKTIPARQYENQVMEYEELDRRIGQQA